MDVDIGFPQSGGSHGLDLNVLAQSRAQQFRHFRDHAVGVDRLRRQRLLARECEQALGQRGGAFGGLHGGVDETADAEFVGLHAPPHHVERTDDHAQHVVEVMGDAAGQLADRVHLLRLAQLALGLFPLIDLSEQALIGGRKLKIYALDRRQRPPCEIRNEQADAADQKEGDS